MRLPTYGTTRVVIWMSYCDLTLGLPLFSVECTLRREEPHVTRVAFRYEQEMFL